MPRRIGSHSHGEFSIDVPALRSSGAYRHDGLIARFGPDAACPTFSWRWSHANADGTSQNHGRAVADLADHEVRRQATVRNPDGLVVEYFEAAR